MAEREGKPTRLMMDGTRSLPLPPFLDLLGSGQLEYAEGAGSEVSS
jgi:hypothetical protein